MVLLLKDSDTEKCFDKLWDKECFNDLHGYGFINDKLSLLYEINKTARVAIKTTTGTTKRVSIQNTIMQGAV